MAPYNRDEWEPDFIAKKLMDEHMNTLEREEYDRQEEMALIDEGYPYADEYEEKPE